MTRFSTDSLDSEDIPRARRSSSGSPSIVSRRSTRVPGARDVVSDRRSRNGPLYEVLITGGTGTAVQVTMRKGDVVKAESDALVSRSRHVDLQSRMEGGWMESLGRAIISNESFFLQRLIADRDDQDILLAPQQPGDIVLLNVHGSQQYNIINGSFLCSDDQVKTEVETQWDFEKAAFGAGLFVLKTSGSGTIAVNSSGSMLHYRLESGDKRVVDNGHVVAWTSGMKYRVNMASKSFFTSVTSGEGMMCFFEGPGDIYVQTHQPMSISTSKEGKVHISTRNSSPIVQIICALVFMCIFCFIILVGGVIAYAAISNPDSFRQTERIRANIGNNRWSP